MRSPLAMLTLLLLAGCHGEQAGPAASSSGPQALTELAPSSKSAVLQTHLPVLLFPAEHAPGAIVTSGERWYAISSRRGPLTVSLHATDVVHHDLGPQPGVERPHRVRGQPAFTLVNDFIRSVTWEEAGVSYVVEVECYEASKDPRCADDTFVLREANSLVEVGPR